MLQSAFLSYIYHKSCRRRAITYQVPHLYYEIIIAVLLNKSQEGEFVHHISDALGVCSFNQR
jgi:hypothetical protein